jgi:hypothetical protein
MVGFKVGFKAGFKALHHWKFCNEERFFWFDDLGVIGVWEFLM